MAKAKAKAKSKPAAKATTAAKAVARAAAKAEARVTSEASVGDAELTANSAEPCASVASAAGNGEIARFVGPEQSVQPARDSTDKLFAGEVL